MRSRSSAGPSASRSSQLRRAPTLRLSEPAGASSGPASAQLFPDREARRAGCPRGHLLPLQPEADGVGHDPLDGSDRKSDAVPSPETAALEKEQHDALLRVDDEAGYVPEPMIVGGDDLARSAELDLPFGNAVVRQREEVPDRDVEARGLVVRRHEHVLDSDVPARLSEKRL